MTTAIRKRVRAKPADRRRQIIDEAVRLIGERGYFGFSTREVAERCRLTDPGLLHYFGSKEKLLIAVLEDRDDQDTRFVLSLARIDPRGDPEPRLTLRQVLDLFRATVVRNSAQPEILRLFVVLRTEAMNESHPAHDYFVAYRATILDGFTRCVAAHVPEPRSTALQLMALMGGLEQEWLRSDRDFDMVEEWDRAVSRLLPCEAPILDGAPG
jgi:AcrR family transcriptional regulator